MQRELVPTNRFRYELLARIPGLVGQRLPFDIELAGQTVSLNVKLRQFPPVGLRTTVSLKHIAVNDANLARTLIGLQRVSQDDPMAAVMRRSLGMMVDLHHRRYTPVDQPSLLCASHIELPEGTPVRPWVEEHTRELVGTLIRTEPADLTKRIVSKIINECDEINEKISATYTLSRVPA